MKTLILGTFVASALSIPGAAFAAMYAYVDQAGVIRSVEADSAAQAFTVAPQIDENSGVMLLDSQEDYDIVGDTVPGA